MDNDLLVARSALDLPAKIAGVQADTPDVELWHLLRALLEWADAQTPRVDFDAVLQDVRDDYRA